MRIQALESAYGECISALALGEAQVSRNQKEVLWIDDDVSFLMALRAFFSDSPHIRLFTVQSATEAFQLMGRRGFDLLVSDLDLPDMGCVELLRGLRLLSSSPILGIVSARHDPQCLRDCRDMLSFVRTKPVDLEEMERLFLEVPAASDRQRPEDSLEPSQAGDGALES